MLLWIRSVHHPPPASQLQHRSLLDWATCVLLLTRPANRVGSQHLMTPVCSWQECLQPVSLIKTFPRFSRLSSQMNVLFTILPTAHHPAAQCTPGEGISIGYVPTLSAFDTLANTAEALPSSPQPLPSLGQEHWGRTLNSCTPDAGRYSYAGLPSGWGTSLATELFSEQVWWGTWLLWSTEEINNIPKN